MQLGRAKADPVHEPVRQRSFAILEARSDLRDDYVAVAKVGEAIRHVGEGLGPRKIEAAMFAHGFHRYERNLSVWGNRAQLRGVDVVFGNKLQPLDLPMRR